MALLGDGKDDDGSPQRLGNDVEDSKEENLGVGRDVASTLTKDEGDGVEGPNDEESKRDLVVEAADLLRAEVAVAASRPDEGVEDVEHRRDGDGKEDPAGTNVRVETGDETSDDHGDVGKDGNEDLAKGHTGQEGNVEDQERGGDEPVDVAGYEDLTLGRVTRVVTLVGEGAALREWAWDNFEDWVSILAASPMWMDDMPARRVLTRPVAIAR